LLDEFKHITEIKYLFLEIMDLRTVSIAKCAV